MNLDFIYKDIAMHHKLYYSKMILGLFASHQCSPIVSHFSNLVPYYTKLILKDSDCGQGKPTNLESLMLALKICKPPIKIL